MTIGSNNQGPSHGYRPGWGGSSSGRIAGRLLAVLVLILLPLFSTALPAQGRGPASAARLPGASTADAADERAADGRQPGEPLAASADNTNAPQTIPDSSANNPAPGSVRARGAEAPRAIVTPTAVPAPTPATNRARQATSASNSRQVTGESAPLNSSTGASRTGSAEEDRKTRQSAADLNIRLWPIKDGKFTFTQGFGCVAQIGNFYQANQECPAGAPVVHTGIDLAAPQGTPFYAAASGWVTESGLDRATGLANTRIVIQHVGKNDRYATEYLHWISSFVKVGDYVEAGDPIAEVGSVGYSTGPHLHFGVIDLNVGSPIDPLGWLPENRSVGNYQTIEPDTKRQTFRNRSSGTPDYEDPAPPATPKRVPVPKSPRANQNDGQNTKQAGGAASDETSARHDRRKDRRITERKTERQANDGAAKDAKTGGKSTDGKNSVSKRAAERDRTREDAASTGADESSPGVTPTPAPDPADSDAAAGKHASARDRKKNGGGNDRAGRRDRNDASAKDDKKDGGANGNGGDNSGATDQNSKDDPQKDQQDGGKNPGGNNHPARDNGSTETDQNASGAPAADTPTPTPEPAATDETPADDANLEESEAQAVQPDSAAEREKAPDKTAVARPETIARNAANKSRGQGKK